MARYAVWSVVALSVSIAAACKTAGSSVVKDEPTQAASAGGAAADPLMLVAFAAKGTNVGIDGGFMRALRQKYGTALDNRIIVSGSSSGSIMAGLFGCWGLNDDGMGVMDATLKIFNKSDIDMDDNAKTKAILGGYGDRVGLPQSNLDKIIDTLTRQGTCVPKYPMVIAAANQDALDVREHVIGTRLTIPFVGSSSRTLDMETYSVWTNHPITRRAGSYIERACTYFVDSSMYAKLQQVPSDQRLCDLHLVSTASDLNMAIRASVSEPTYFPAVVEQLGDQGPDPASLTVNKGPPPLVRPVIPGNPDQITLSTSQGTSPGLDAWRLYNGGYVMAIVTQDIKRALPGIFAFGTGRTYFSGSVARFIGSWFLVPLNESIDRGRYWLDAEIPYTDAEWTTVGAATTTVQDNLDMGVQKAMACLSEQVDCKPAAGKAPAAGTVDATGQNMQDKIKRGMSFLNQSMQGAAAPATSPATAPDADQGAGS